MDPIRAKRAKTTPSWKRWRSILVGNTSEVLKYYQESERRKRESPGETLQNILEDEGFRVYDIAVDIFHDDSFKISKKERMLDLAIVSPRDLGFTAKQSPKNIWEIFDRAVECGLNLCPVEVGPFLRLQYDDQPKGETLYLAMNPVAYDEYESNIFVVAREVGVWFSISGIYLTPEGIEYYLGEPLKVLYNEDILESRWVFLIGDTKLL